MASSPSVPSQEEREFYAALGRLGGARAKNPYPIEPGKAFELWLAFRMAAYWQHNGAIVELLNGAGNLLAPGDEFVVRGGPGLIGRSDVKNPGSIRINFQPNILNPDDTPVASYELVGSLQFHGRSAALHECDIALVPSQICAAIRRRPINLKVGYPSGRPPVALECKKHAGDGPIGEAREMLARLFDLTRYPTLPPRYWGQLFWPYDTPSYGGGKRPKLYREAFEDGFYAIVRNKGFHSGAISLCTHYRVRTWAKMKGRRANDLALAIKNHLAAHAWTERDGSWHP